MKENILKVLELVASLAVIGFAEKEFLGHFFSFPADDPNPVRNRILTMGLAVGFAIFGIMLIPWTISALNS